MPRTSITASIEMLEIRRLLDGSLPGVPDVEAQFDALKHHGESVAWHLRESDGAPDPSSMDHFQGIARYPGKGTPIMYVTQKDDDDNGSIPVINDEQEGGYLEVVRLGSRDGDGERLRSNRLAIGTESESTPPPAEDTFISKFHLDGTEVAIDGGMLRPYIHPGGMAIIDNVLFVAMDTPDGPGLGGEGAIVLFNLGENGELRETPVPIQVLPLDHSIDNLAITPIGTGATGDPERYLIWTNGDGGNAITVYQTNSRNLRFNSFALLPDPQVWHSNTLDDFDPGFPSPPANPSIFWPTDASAHQSSTFIRQFDGDTPPVDAPLYMVAMRHSGPFGLPLEGEEFADLYRVTFKPNGDIKLTLARTLHEFAVYDGVGRIGNFAAATGGYVSPTGELILYSAPHDDDTDQIVSAGEWRHRDMHRPGSPLLVPIAEAGSGYVVNEGGSIQLGGAGGPTRARPWVELFDDTFGWLHKFEHPDDHEGDRSLVVDYDDRDLSELDDFGELDGPDDFFHGHGFNDKPTSVRWRLPVGLNVELFDDTGFSDRKIILLGTGEIEEISELNSQDVDPDFVLHPGKNPGENLDFSDKTSSMRFVGTDPNDGEVTLEWDLDADGIFGETGAAAAHGNETGSTPTFVVGALDGPGDYPVSLRVTDSLGASSIDTTTVTVQNVAPTAGITGDTFGVSGMPRNFNLTANDPSAADQLAGFDFAIDFGDGNSTVVSAGSPLPISHTYLTESIFTVTVTATDQDGATSTPVTLQIEIKAAGIVPDPVDPTKTALAVGGTLGDDKIKVEPKGKTGAFEVKINGESKGLFTPTGRIIIFGQAGDDHIDVPDSVKLPVEMYGGDGDDKLGGAGGPDLLVGGDGDDDIKGKKGRDILIGGAGKDDLHGEGDDDVIVGSATIHDDNFAALHAIQAEWLRTDIGFAARSAHLVDGTGLNGPTARLDAASILDDALNDHLAGASGEDFVRQ